MLNMIISERQAEENRAVEKRIEARKKYDSGKVAEYVIVLLFGAICFASLAVGCWMAVNMDNGQTEIHNSK